MEIYYVYKHTFSNGTVYFGKGSKNRINSNKRNRYWMNLYKKYGEPKREYLNTGISEDLAYLLEEAYIYNSKRFGFCTCNISVGGEASASGNVQSEETRKRISQKLKGVKKSEATKLKMSQAQKQINRTRANRNTELHTCNRQTVLQFSKDRTEVVAEYISIIEASNITGVNHGNISSVCRGNLKSAGNFYWAYKYTKRN